MKKSITLLASVILFTSFSFFTACSNNDDNSDNELKYSARLEEDCGEDGVTYCITKQEYERIGELLESIPPNDPCIWISITDIDNNNHSGYLRSRGASSSNSVCN